MGLRIDHVALPCYDVAATHAFAASLLELPLTASWSGYSDTWRRDTLMLVYALPHARALVYFNYRGLARRRDDGLPHDIRHAGFTCGSRGAIARWKRKLDDTGLAYVVEDHGDGEEHLYFDDPNGHVFEIGARPEFPGGASRAALATMKRWLARATIVGGASAPTRVAKSGRG